MTVKLNRHLVPGNSPTEAQPAPAAPTPERATMPRSAPSNANPSLGPIAPPAGRAVRNHIDDVSDPDSEFYDPDDADYDPDWDEENREQNCCGKPQEIDLT